MLIISKNLIHQIFKQAEEGYPYEICGFMIGKQNFADNVREVFEVIQVENQNKERASDRFEISPKDYLKVQEYADLKGFEIVGIYHSHPDHPDRPSQTDRAYALEYTSYIIVSVNNAKAESFRSWQLVDGQFQEEEVKIV